QSPEDDITNCTAALSRGGYDNFEVTVVTGNDARLAAARSASASWVVFLEAADLPLDSFLQTMVGAQPASDADVVTCGLQLEAAGGGPVTERVLGEPGALGLGSNAYGTVGLIRRSLLPDDPQSWPATSDPDWALLAHLSAAGARIVSIPAPLVRRGH